MPSHDWNNEQLITRRSMLCWCSHFIRFGDTLHQDQTISVMRITTLTLSSRSCNYRTMYQDYSCPCFTIPPISAFPNTPHQPGFISTSGNYRVQNPSETKFKVRVLCKPKTKAYIFQTSIRQEGKHPTLCLLVSNLCYLKVLRTLALYGCCGQWALTCCSYPFMVSSLH